ncbi:MAG TPA: aromatic-ring-hydroxylating dioxygenase subunit beta [Burkholderiales bacterium]|jgi:3-phenylpropionate/cinnamic acid dioxygenase small subunit|nr:aromatic-ring-hydroxylating dioxygenase subunit beta [Burkholderiales bacterium]
MAANAIERQYAAEQLLARYAQALDGDALESWPDFFVEEGRYSILTAENYSQGLPLPLVQADSRAMLRDRVAALRHANIYEAQHYRHLVSCTVLEKVDAHTVKAVSNFMVARIMHDGATTLFATGRYLDRIRLSNNAADAKFEERLVILDSSRIDTLLAIPL